MCWGRKAKFGVEWMYALVMEISIGAEIDSALLINSILQRIRITSSTVGWGSSGWTEMKPQNQKASYKTTSSAASIQNNKTSNSYTTNTQIHTITHSLTQHPLQVHPRVGAGHVRVPRQFDQFVVRGLHPLHAGVDHDLRLGLFR